MHQEKGGDIKAHGRRPGENWRSAFVSFLGHLFIKKPKRSGEGI
jgi:hypothetical protein